MNRNNSIRNLALAISLAGLSLFTSVGCVAEATDQDVLTGEESVRKAHYVGAADTDEDSTEPYGEPYATKRPLVHPNNGNNLGPRPEPWMSDGEANGPRPEPWAQQGEPEDSSGSSSSSSSSSGGTPGNPKPSSR